MKNYNLLPGWFVREVETSKILSMMINLYTILTITHAWLVWRRRRWRCAPAPAGSSAAPADCVPGTQAWTSKRSIRSIEESTCTQKQKVQYVNFIFLRLPLLTLVKNHHVKNLLLFRGNPTIIKLNIKNLFC